MSSRIGRNVIPLCLIPLDDFCRGEPVRVIRTVDLLDEMKHVSVDLVVGQTLQDIATQAIWVREQEPASDLLSIVID